jgi:MFS family permease
VQAALVSVAATSCALVAIGSDVLTLTLARAMIGLGFAGGLMSGFKAIVIWVPEPRRALANACVMSFGALGLLTPTAPSEFATRMMGWRMLFLALTVVPQRKAERSVETLGEQVCQLAGIFRDRAFLAIAPPLATTAGTHIAIQTLWAGPDSATWQGSTEWGRQLPVHHWRRVFRRHPVERSDRRLVRAPRLQRTPGDDWVPGAVLRLPGRDCTRGARAWPSYLVRLRHQRAGGPMATK